MDLSFLLYINYFAVAVSSVMFFMLGSFWFSSLFSSMWVQELENHNVIIQEPTKNILLLKMLLTFAANIIVSFAMACLVLMTGSATILSGLMLGTLVALGFAATTLASVFVWENRSLKLFLIDIGYPILGIITAAMILSVWY